MDDELQAFRSQWQQEVAARRTRVPALKTSASGASSKAARPPPPRDGARTTTLRTDTPSHHPDTLLTLLDTLAASHAASVQRMQADAQTDAVDELCTALASTHIGTCVAEMYAADPAVPMYVGRLPDEVWLHILREVIQPTRISSPTPAFREHIHFVTPSEPWRPYSGPDYIALERIGRVCWRLRRLTAHARLWKEIVACVYVPPHPSVTAPPCSWRDTFLYEPRLRMNGAYIATCQYTQQGMSEENVWVRVLHQVEFFRYLRFFPQGQCLSWLTTDPPSESVHQLWPGLQTKGCTTGRWRLLADDDRAGCTKRGATIVVEDLYDPSLRSYTFQMTLALRPSRGTWHRLDMLAYTSLHLHTGEVLPIPQKHSKPFLFSRVRSYGV
ncbi:SCF ubiquitin ligase complex protein [Malassezia pachydermatis]|uniref:F-box domain-containing protein n=1 Tax=Malassezia pachydermatis TaxID=77020 RepID=A0A0M9VNR8_9BASI|nr:f-box domain-containing protein [Malassezia pachydermatis]KOS13602.1 f-box domain-containing protein [Malassezia pachydermatis]